MNRPMFAMLVIILFCQAATRHPLPRDKRHLFERNPGNTDAASRDVARLYFGTVVRQNCPHGAVQHRQFAFFSLASMTGRSFLAMVATSDRVHRNE